MLITEFASCMNQHGITFSERKLGMNEGWNNYMVDKQALLVCKQRGHEPVGGLSPKLFEMSENSTKP